MGQSLKEIKNSILGDSQTAGIIPGSNISKSIDSSSGNITLSATNTTYNSGTNITIDGSNINLDSNISIDRLTMNYGGSGDGNEVTFKNDEYHYIKYISPNGLRIAGFGDTGPVCKIY